MLIVQVDCTRKLNVGCPGVLGGMHRDLQARMHHDALQGVSLSLALLLHTFNCLTLLFL